MNSTQMVTVGNFLIPEDRQIRMIEDCANKIFTASTIKDVLLAIKRADAIAAITRKIEASERVRKTAAFLLIQAERQLGEITAKIPRQTNGSKISSLTPAQSKRQALAQHGLKMNRCLMAERLSRTPAPEVEAAFERAPHKSLNSVNIELGIKKPHLGPNKAERLAEEAIKLLETCYQANRAPRRDEINGFTIRLTALRVVK